MATTVRRIGTFVQKLAKIARLDTEETMLAKDVVVGISKKESCKVSDIARTLKEKGPLREIARRFYEGLADKTSGLDKLRDAWLNLVAKMANKMPFIAVDFSDISKLHGKAFEYLAIVRDASDPRKWKGPGYNTIQIEATDNKHTNLPLWQQIFSTLCPEYRGWYDIVGRAMIRVLEHIGKHATWLFDRAFDGDDFYLILSALKIRWVVRQQQTRNVIIGGGVTVLMRDLAESLRKPFKTEAPYVCKKTHEFKLWPLSFNFVPVRLPNFSEKLWMIVITGLRDEDMVLLTNHKLGNWKQAERIVLAFLRRWGVEEGIRCWKQVTKVEDFRVQNWNSIRRMTFFSMLAYGIQALWLLTRPATAERLIARVKQFIEEVPFKHYRLWAGVKDALDSGA